MIQLDIAPEVEQQVIEAARERGLDPVAYASQIVADAVQYTSPKRLSHEEFKAALDRLASHADKMPQLPDYAYTRESFYEDHD